MTRYLIIDLESGCLFACSRILCGAPALILDPLPGREAIRERPTDLLAIQSHR